MNFKELIAIQTDFNNKLGVQKTIKDYHFALNVELAEFFNTLPWKWWKKEQPIYKDKILDELADVMAFLFSVYDVHFNVNVKNARISEDKKADIIDRCYEFLNEGFALGFKDEPEIINIHYWPNQDIPTLEVNGIKLGSLAYLAQKHTGCTIDEIVESYKNKMLINHARQKRNY